MNKTKIEYRRIAIRNFMPGDESKLSSLARNAFFKYQKKFKDRSFFDTSVSIISKLAEPAELCIAEETEIRVRGVALYAVKNGLC